MNEVTLCFPIREALPRAILLGYKKIGFGRGKYVGFGGKIRAGETIRQAAVRELAEETGLRAAEADLEAMGVLTFLFPARPEWDHKVHVFLTRKWQGTPVDSEEITPIWFPLYQPPYQRMWNDSASWLPLVLDGQQVEATFVYNEDNETVGEMRMEPQSSM